MNKIIESILKSEFPKLNVEIAIFKHKRTQEIRFCVMTVNTGLTGLTHHHIYNASEWDKLDSKLLEGTQRIQEAFHNDLINKYTEIKCKE